MNKQLIIKALLSYRKKKVDNLKNANLNRRHNIASKRFNEICEIDIELSKIGYIHDNKNLRI